MFQTKQLPANRDVVAPDGSNVRILLGTNVGGLAHFELGAGATSVAVRHRTVEEVWYFLSGRGEMWRRTGEVEATVAVGPGTCVTIPLGTTFQFRATGTSPLTAVAVTMPPWPGDGEAIAADGPWTATVSPGPGLDAVG